MKTGKNIGTLFSALFVFLLCCFSVRASDNDLIIKFMVDSSDSMKAQDIVDCTASILAAEIDDFIKNSSQLCAGYSTRILVDSFWQNDNSIQTKEIFDYRLGQSDSPNYKGLREFETKWFVEDETALNKVINRNWPAGNRNTVLVVLTNSQKKLDLREISEINNDAKKVNSRMIIVDLPRKNNYKETALKAELAKRIHGATEEVKAYISSIQFGMAIEVTVNDKSVDPGRTITAEAPVRIELNAQLKGETRFFWKVGDDEKTSKKCSLSLDKAASFTATAVGYDSMGGEHRQDVKFEIRPIPRPVADFSVFPVSGVAPLVVSISNKSKNAQQYQWDWGDGTPGAVESEPKHTYDIPGKYTISLSVLGKNGDVASKTAEITVTKPSTIAVADFSAIPVSGVAPLSIAVSNKSKNAQKYHWDWGDGTPPSEESEPRHTYNSPGKYTVQLDVLDRNGDIVSKTATINVYNPPPVASFAVPAGISTNVPVEFTNNSQYSTRWEWTFGDDNSTSSVRSPIHTFKTAGTFKVALRAYNSDGAVAQTEETVVVSEKLAAAFEWEPVSPGSTTIRFRNQSRGAVRYEWNFGDGKNSSEENPSHQFAAQESKRFPVSLTVYSPDGKKETKEDIVRITVDQGAGQSQPQPQQQPQQLPLQDDGRLTADFSFETKSGPDGFTVTFTNKSKGATKYEWDFGDEEKSKESDPVHTYVVSEASDMKVSLVVTDSDGQTSKKVKTVHVLPPSSGLSSGMIWGIVSAVAALCVIVVVVVILRRKKVFAVSLFSKENKLLGKKKVKVGEIVPITSLNGANDMDFQIVKSEDDDGGDEFRVRFRKPEESQSVLKQKSYRIHLSSQWCDPIDMANLSVDAGRLVFSDGDDEEDANE